MPGARNQWEQFNTIFGKVVHMAFSESGIWCLGGEKSNYGDYRLYYRPYEVDAWILQQNVCGVRVAATWDNKAWLVTNLGEVFWPFHDRWIKAPALPEARMGIIAKDIAIGGKGENQTIGVLSNMGSHEGYVFYKAVTDYTNPPSWEIDYSKGAVKIAVGAAGGLWIIDNEGQVYHRKHGREDWQLYLNNPDYDDKPEGIYGFGDNGGARDIACSWHGGIWVLGEGVTSGNGIYALRGTLPQRRR
jgi:hypothetical protein